MSLKKIIGQIHLWLGLTSGGIVFMVSITGCILAFEHEIKSLTQSYRYAEAVEGKKVLLPSELKAIGEKAMGGIHASAIVYNEPGKSTAVSFLVKKPRSFQQVFIHPYTGKVLGVWNQNDDFFRFILNGHFNLWLPRPIGSPIVSYATLIFTILLITGMILWWPKNLKKSNTDKSFKIKWKAKWRRVNYDLHNVPGFYIFFIALLIALTGMTFGLHWFFDASYMIASGGKSTPERMLEPLSDSTKAYTASAEHNMDVLWEEVASGIDKDAIISVSCPDKISSIISVMVNTAPGTYYKAYTRYFDQHTGKEFTGKELFEGRKEELAYARTLHNLYYDIHVGEIFGFPGKVLAFVASFVCASLPVSGFIIWWGRKKKEKKALEKEKKNTQTC